MLPLILGIIVTLYSCSILFISFSLTLWSTQNTTVILGEQEVVTVSPEGEKSAEDDLQVGPSNTEEDAIVDVEDLNEVSWYSCLAPVLVRFCSGCVVGLTYIL